MVNSHSGTGGGGLYGSGRDNKNCSSRTNARSFDDRTRGSSGIDDRLRGISHETHQERSRQMNDRARGLDDRPRGGGGGLDRDPPMSTDRSPTTNDTSTNVEHVKPSVVYDIASLILYRCQALPIRLKIALDRLFKVLSREEVVQLLHGFGWSDEDYARGYMLQVSL